ncbi:MAG TPA: hypothetical protein VFF73_20205, partial [Planctomycetota bacterium]|nr:hypothetical protein [Planctomycetota bacterium]
MRLRYVLVVGVLLSGCLDRKETIKVQADGGVSVAFVLKGDPGEFKPDRVDVLPGGAGWKVTDEDVARDDGNGSDHVRRAEASFARIEDAPSSFGAADDPAPLTAHTTLRREATKEGTRYVFERRYVPRAYAWRERIFRRTVPEDVIKALSESPKEGAAHDEAVKRATSALLAFEREKNQVLLEEALGTT